MAQNKKQAGGNGFDLSSMTPVQKKAAVVVAACALVLVVTISVVSVLVAKHHAGSRGDQPESNPQSGSSSSAVVVTPDFDTSEFGDAVLGATDDAGKKYIEETVFVGDSNTNLFYQNGLLSLNQVLAVDGLGIQSFASDKSIYFKKDNNAYSIPEAIAKMKPRRIIMMMGTNNTDGSMTADAFVQSYKAAVEAIKTAYPYTDIIIAAVPPVPQDHSTYPNVSMEVINDFNKALAKMCMDEGLKFLNTTEELLGSDGFGKASCFRPGDIHLKKDGLVTIMDYARTHAYLGTEDRRPDTKNIPSRRTGTAGSNTDTTPEVEKEDGKTYTAQYTVEKNVGGTLQSSDQKDVTTLSFKDLTKKSSITVTAIPAEGYEFKEWSDGNKNPTRTDTGFEKPLNVIAMFDAKLLVTIEEGSSKEIRSGESIKLTAKVTGAKEDESKIIWSVGGKEIGKGKTCTFKPEKYGKYELKATVTANGKTKDAKFDLTVICVHNWVEDTTNPTIPPCVDGKKYYKCSICGESKEETVPAKEKHKLVGEIQIEKGKEPTCTSEGVGHQKCETCQQMIEVTVPKLEHDWDRSVVISEKPSTCKEKGYKEYKCKHCVATYKEEQPLLETHTPGEPIIKQEFPCLPGTKTIICTICGKEISVETIDPTAEHSVSTWTEIENGQEKGTCDVCHTEVTRAKPTE